MTELSFPPVFKICSMFRLQYIKLGSIQGQLGRIRFSRQGDGSDNFPAAAFDISPKVGKSPAHPHEIVDEEIFLSNDNFPIENRLPGKSPISIRSGVLNHVGLDDVRIGS